MSWYSVSGKMVSPTKERRTKSNGNSTQVLQKISVLDKRKYFRVRGMRNFCGGSMVENRFKKGVRGK